MTKIIKKYQSVRISFKYFIIVASAHGNMKKELMQQESGSTFQVAHHALLALPLSPIDLHMQNRRWSLRTHCLQEINSLRVSGSTKHSSNELTHSLSEASYSKVLPQAIMITWHAAMVRRQDQANQKGAQDVGND